MLEISLCVTCIFVTTRILPYSLWTLLLYFLYSFPDWMPVDSISACRYSCSPEAVIFLAAQLWLSQEPSWTLLVKMRQGFPTEEGQVLLHARMAETWCHLTSLNTVIMLVYVHAFNSLLIIFMNYLWIRHLKFVLLAYSYLLAFKNENQFTWALVLINNAELNDCLMEHSLGASLFMSGNFGYLLLLSFFQWWNSNISLCSLCALEEQWSSTGGALTWLLKSTWGKAHRKRYLLEVVPFLCVEKQRNSLNFCFPADSQCRQSGIRRGNGIICR